MESTPPLGRRPRPGEPASPLGRARRRRRALGRPRAGAPVRRAALLGALAVVLALGAGSADAAPANPLAELVVPRTRARQGRSGSPGRAPFGDDHERTRGGRLVRSRRHGSDGHQGRPRVRLHARVRRRRLRRAAQRQRPDRRRHVARHLQGPCEDAGVRGEVAARPSPSPGHEPPGRRRRKRERVPGAEPRSRRCRAADRAAGRQEADLRHCGRLPDRQDPLRGGDEPRRQRERRRPGGGNRAEARTEGS